MKLTSLICTLVVSIILLLLEDASINAQGTETYSGVGRLPAFYTWYICSRVKTNYIGYDMQQVNTSQSENSNFGTVVQGNHPIQYNQFGLLTYATNYTGIQLYIDQTRPASYYFADLSCFDGGPQSRCTKSKDPPFNGTDILCLAVSNPENIELKFILSVSFTSGTSPPPLPSVPTTTTTKSDTTTAGAGTTTPDPTQQPTPILYGLGVSGNGIGSLWVWGLLCLASTVFTFTYSWGLL
ncbi:11767_t:CDS:2 [Acaulospora morrowiae]|uniref:11767_t:CDS:1 n=1 Tax=Acaulospora morrowiae TaxID=94023 RepID=A0A9N8W139_9GLOM|nr:11767_t:CDS:2 [Acaulospora morrowiae]